jgi:[ribosomal protein S18]-alanine N-acetyltransferase
LLIRTLSPPDVDAVLAIQSACPEIAQWSAWDYERVARGEMAGWIAEANRSVVGFLVARRVAEDAEILNFAVQSSWRGQGIGAALLQASLDWAKSFAASRALLEVRASNSTALAFYRRHNFEIAGRRPGYYSAPLDDALLLTARLGQAASA